MNFKSKKVLLWSRQEDGCAEMILNGRTILVVAGGRGEGLETLDSVEFWRFMAVFLTFRLFNPYLSKNGRQIWIPHQIVTRFFYKNRIILMHFKQIWLFIVVHKEMNPAFIGIRLFSSEMSRFLHKIGQNYEGNGLSRPFWSISRYLGYSINRWRLTLFESEMPFFT